MKNFKSEEPCLICGDILACYHHIKHQKSAPNLKFDKRNLMSLCRKHHNEIHCIGKNTFIKKYSLKNYMEDKGWIYDSFFNKWILE